MRQIQEEAVRLGSNCLLILSDREFNTERKAHYEGVYLKKKKMPQKNTLREKLYEMEQVTRVRIHLKEGAVKIRPIPCEVKDGKVIKCSSKKCAEDFS